MKPGFHLFQLEYDHSKIKSAAPFQREENQRKEIAYGVVWPPTGYNPEGGVSLSDSRTYRSVSDMEEALSEKGSCTITWLGREMVCEQ